MRVDPKSFAAAAVSVLLRFDEFSSAFMGGVLSSVYHLSVPLGVYLAR